MFGNFRVRGNRSHIRVEKELAGIDKIAADEAFKKCKRIILDEYLSAKGFVKYKVNAYVRRNKIDVLEYINLQKERRGSKTFTVNYAIMPLYIPHDYLAANWGGRLGSLICDKDIWWDYANEKIAYVSFKNILKAIDKFLLPWFSEYSNEEYLMEKLLEEEQRRKRTGVNCRNQIWGAALGECENKNEIISQNIKKLKLPSKLLC